VKLVLRLLLVAQLLLSSQLYAEEVLVISRGVDRAMPIAVVPFAASGMELAEDAAMIVSNDLRNSGLFAPIERKNFISMPAFAEEIIFRDWRAVGAQYLVIGNASRLPDQRIQLNYALYNVAAQQQVLAASTTGTDAQLRDLAHHVADRIYQSITGDRGAFSTRLLFVSSQRDERGQSTYQLHHADYDGARAKTILRSSEPILSPAYGPDGKRVAYVSFEQKKPRIYIQDIATGQREQITNFPGLNGAPAWSPDGSKLAFVLSKDGNPEIYALDLASRNLQRVTNHAAIDTEPFWGKDGKTIYFTSDRSGRPQIYKTTLGSQQTQRVTFVGNYNANPKLSADEKTLVMIHRQEGFTVFKVAALDLEKERLRILSNTSLDESPTVAPNGSMVIYATRQQGKGVLILSSLNGRVRTVLPGISGEVREPAWSPFLSNQP